MNRQDWREGYLRIAGLFHRRRSERELAEELEFHLAMKLEAGKSAEEANREFGGFEKWKEVCRDVSWWRALDELGRDLMLAVRTLRKSPVFTVIAIATLTLAIGANTAVFTLMNELMLKSVPGPNAKRLAIFRIQPEIFDYTFSYPVVQALEGHSAAVMRVFALSDRIFDLRTSDGIETLPGELVSGGYFSALGVKAQLGRCIEPQDDRAGSRDGMVAVISYHFWQSRMGKSGAVLRQKIVLNRTVFTIIGILPKQFRGITRDRAPEVFLPLQVEPLLDSPFSLISAGYRAWWLSVGGLLDEGVSLEQANAFLRANAREFLQVLAPPPNFRLGRHKLSDLQVIAEPGATGISYLRLRFRKPLGVLMGLLGTVLLIACLNLATLLTARATSRAREISTRFALGASRARLVRQLLTESLLLALTGAGLGLALAPSMARFVAIMLKPQRSVQFAPLEVRPDLSVFGFTALLVIVVTVLAGTLPALRSTRDEFHVFIKEGSNSIRSAERRHWWPKLLLGIEVALSLVLATGAGLLGYSLIKLHQTRLGFEPRGLLFLLPGGKAPIVDRKLLVAYQQLIEQIETLPNVEKASISAAVPINSTYINDNMQAPGGPKYHFQENAVGPDYFKTLGTPFLAGREFRWTDVSGSEQKVILNASAARLLFPDGKVLGHYVVLQDGKTQAEVAGIVADSKYSSLRDAAPPMVYFAAAQSLMPGAWLDLLIRTKGPAGPLVTAVRKLAKRILPDVPFPAAMSMEQTIADSLATERIMSTLALFFGGLSLLITGIGLYGTLAYSTERRTGEIGIRLALGARREDIVSMISAENGLIVTFGCIAGLVGSALAAKTVASLLYGVSAHDPVVFIASAGMLLCVAAAASLIPAIRAASIDPLEAIRYE